MFDNYSESLIYIEKSLEEDPNNFLPLYMIKCYISEYLIINKNKVLYLIFKYSNTINIVYGDYNYDITINRLIEKVTKLEEENNKLKDRILKLEFNDINDLEKEFNSI